jgi:serine/alanine adding enzyme
LQYRIVSDINLIDTGKWSSFVNSHPCGNFFQTPDFFRFIASVPSYKPVVTVAFSKEDNITGVLLGVIQKEKGYVKRKFSSRLIVWGGPLLADSSADAMDDLLRSFIEHNKKQCIYFEFRNQFDLSSQKKIFEDNGFLYSEHLNFIVNTENEKQTAKAISDSKKRQIKKSLLNEAGIIEAESLEQVKIFYGILRQLYINKVKKPLPDWEFFEQFYKRPELGKYFLIQYKGEIIGGIMCPVFGNKAIYEWYIAGEDGKYKGINPSVLATWAPIEYAIKNGIKNFDFLGAGKPADDYGVRQFKAGFGGQLVSYGRFTRINNPVMYNMGKKGLVILKHFNSLSLRKQNTGKPVQES